MHFIYLLIATLFTFGLSVNTAFACSCSTKPSAIEAWKQADVVISGKVLSTSENPRGNYEQINIEVNKSWKGGNPAVIRVISDLDDWSCDYIFSRGESYLIFAKRDDRGHLHVSQCTPTVALHRAAPLIKDLGNPEDLSSTSSSDDVTQPQDNFGGQRVPKRDYLQEYRQMMNPNGDTDDSYRLDQRPFHLQ